MAPRWSLAAQTARVTCTIIYALGCYMSMFLWPLVYVGLAFWRRARSGLQSAGPVPEPPAILGRLGGSPRSWGGIDSLNAAVCQVLERQIREGKQLGVCVAAYYRGRLVCSSGAGVMRPIDGSGPWQHVQEDTLFLCNSLTKGISATALMSLVDEVRACVRVCVCACVRVIISVGDGCGRPGM